MIFNGVGAFVYLDVILIVLVAFKISRLALHLNYKNPIFATLIKLTVIYGRYCG
jgi:hypothetical protein